MPPQAATVRFFAPEQMGQVDLFSMFCGSTYTFKPHERRALAGVRQHFDKAMLFLEMAQRDRETLKFDHDELNEKGFTPATNARRLGSIVEAAILELYSSVDCTVKVMRAIYGETSRGFKESTRGLFGNAGKITGSFPDELRQFVLNSDWYTELRVLRDALTHFDTGSCHLDSTLEHINYMHPGMREGDRVLIIDDIFEWFDKKFEAVNRFLGSVFQYLRGTLHSGPVTVFCGMAQGRMLMRFVSPKEKIDFACGTCGSYQWFELPENPICPFVSACGAYAKTRPHVEAAKLLAERQSKTLD